MTEPNYNEVMLKAEWEETENAFDFKCSNCGQLWLGGKLRYRHCPSCGYYMKNSVINELETIEQQ